MLQYCSIQLKSISIKQVFGHQSSHLKNDLNCNTLLFRVKIMNYNYQYSIELYQKKINVKQELQLQKSNIGRKLGNFRQTLQFFHVTEKFHFPKT